MLNSISRSHWGARCLGHTSPCLSQSPASHFSLYSLFPLSSSSDLSSNLQQVPIPGLPRPLLCSLLHSTQTPPRQLLKTSLPSAQAPQAQAAFHYREAFNVRAVPCCSQED